MAQTFTHKVALVTGAGIGAAAAEMIVARGARVTLLGCRREPLERVAKRIGEAGGKALIFPGDTSIYLTRGD